MAEKGKRLNKFLGGRAGLKGQLKPVGTLEEAHIILIENEQCIHRSAFMGKDAYKRMVENGRTFPSDMVHFLVFANPRNSRSIERSLLSNKVGTLKFGYK